MRQAMPGFQNRNDMRMAEHDAYLRWFALVSISAAISVAGVMVASNLMLISDESDLRRAPVLIRWMVVNDYVVPCGAWLGVMSRNSAGRSRGEPLSTETWYNKAVAILLAITSVVRIAGITLAAVKDCHPKWSGDGCEVLPLVAFAHWLVTFWVLGAIFLVGMRAGVRKCLKGCRRSSGSASFQ